jgi:hypothetical protein
MKKLIKGSKAAKDFMAKIRAKRKVNGVKESKQLKKELAAKNIRLPHGYITTKKLSGLNTLNFKGKKITQTNSGYYQFYSNIKRKFLKFNSLQAAKEMINNEIISKEIKTKLSAKKLKLPHGYEAIKRTRKVSGLHKDTNSHNVNLRIVSGVQNKFLQVNNELANLSVDISLLKKQIFESKRKIDKDILRKVLRDTQKSYIALKKYSLTLLK